jgi:hypothetical protein
MNNPFIFLFAVNVKRIKIQLKPELNSVKHNSKYFLYKFAALLNLGNC